MTEEEKEEEEYEDELVTSHSDEYPEIHGKDAGPGLMMAEDDEDTPITDMLYRSSKFKPIEPWTTSWDEFY